MSERTDIIESIGKDLLVFRYHNLSKHYLSDEWDKYDDSDKKPYLDKAQEIFKTVYDFYHRKHFGHIVPIATLPSSQDLSKITSDGETRRRIIEDAKLTLPSETKMGEAK